MNWQKEKTVNKKDDQYDSSSQAGFGKDKSFDPQKLKGQSGTSEQDRKAEHFKPETEIDLNNESSEKLNVERSHANTSKSERTFEDQINGPKDFEKNRTENKSNQFGRL